MFVTMPQYEFAFPLDLTSAGDKYWRMIGTTLHSALYIVTVRGSAEHGILETFIVAWDHDVAQALGKIGGALHSLVCIAPNSDAGGRSWTAVPLEEVWWAENSSESGGRQALFVGADGAEYSGLFGERTFGAKRLALVASVSR